MPASKAKSLSSLFLKAVKTKSAATSKLAPSTKQSPPKASGDLAIGTLKLETGAFSEHPTRKLSKDISSLLFVAGDTSLDLCSPPDLEPTIDEKSDETLLDIPWFSRMSNSDISLRRKEMSRERKQKWTFKNTQTSRFHRLVRMCGNKLGTDATLQVFGKLGRDTGLKEYNALIALCVEKARITDDEEVSLEQIEKAFQIFKSMREQGFQIQDGTYGPFLKLLIDMDMVQEFYLLSGVIKGDNPSLVPRLGYYEMLLWIKVDNIEKIKELCNSVVGNGGENKSNILENYLLALSESGRTEELLQLLDIVDITKVSSVDYVSSIFQSLGRRGLESFAEKFILALKTNDNGAENISKLIFDYAVSMPNLAVDDVALKFKHLHAKMKVAPSSISYEKLIKYCCDSLKVHMALDVVDQMSEAGYKLSIETVNFMSRACEDSFEFNLVHQIHALIRHHDLSPNNETFRSMINLSVRMKDFDGAYGMVNDLQKMNLMPTSSMYNAIMGGYFREKDFYGGMKVLKQMEDADVKPDSLTFSYLIGNCNCEEDINKYYEELKNSGLQVTKHIYMALMNAYASCGQFEKAKKVVLDKGVPVKSLNEIKSVLVSALACHGQVSDALNIYEDIKLAGCDLEPKSILYLIESLQSEGELSRLLQLLDELNDLDYWVDGCNRVILYCVRYKDLRSVIDLLQQLKEKLCNDELFAEVIFDEAFSVIAEAESTHLQLGMDLLQAIKEELGVRPSRKCLDFLLTACANAKDLDNSHIVWKEYQNAGLPYNVLSFLRMYQALLASGDHESAMKLLGEVPQDDLHICYLIEECQHAYIQSGPSEGKKKKKKKRNTS